MTRNYVKPGIRPGRSPFQVRLLERKADAAFQVAMEEWRAEVKVEMERWAELLRDPEQNAAVGLPEELPEEAIAVLSETRALDRLGPKMPNRRQFYIQFGII